MEECVAALGRRPVEWPVEKPSSIHVMTLREGEWTGRRVFTTVLAAGQQALQRPIGSLAAGACADVVLLDENHPDLVSRCDDHWLDAWIFVAGRSAVETVLVGGETVVKARRHIARATIEARYKAVVAKLAAA